MVGAPQDCFPGPPLPHLPDPLLKFRLVFLANEDTESRDSSGMRKATRA